MRAPAIYGRPFGGTNGWPSMALPVWELQQRQLCFVRSSLFVSFVTLCKILADVMAEMPLGAQRP